ncbi:MAG: DegV family protein [Syntrophomonadaceae bacterium]|nr:DegV family protein [Syntrophomonadaceae bacterium]
MARVKVITDSTADLPRDLVDYYNIEVLPMITSLEGIAYRDGVDLTPAQFYEKLASSKELPHTSQHSPQVLREAYQRALDDGQAVVAIHLSSGMSGTMDAANLVKEMYPPSAPLVVIDSRSASLGQGLLALRAAEMAAEGEKLEAIAAEVIALRGRLLSIFMVDTLKYLLMGGRINKVQAMVGSMLDLKPVLHVNPEGRIDQLEKARGRKMALRRLLALMSQHGRNLAGQTAAISHALCLGDAEWLKTEIINQFAVDRVIVGEMGSVIGTHVGPGAVALFFQGEQIQNITRE